MTDNMQDKLIDQLDFFVPTELGVAAKGELDMMTWPFFSIAKTPPKKPLTYERGNNFLKIIPGDAGLPMQSDKELLMYAASHIRRQLDQGVSVGPRIRFGLYEFLVWAGRSTGGNQYQLMDSCLDRLQGAQIRANMDTATHRDKVYDGFVHSARMIEDKRTSITAVELNVSDWIFEGIANKRLLSYHKGYFKIRGSLGKRLYEIVRKGCGGSPRWEIGVTKLYEYSGTNQSKSKFRYAVKQFVASKAIPEYALSLDEDRDVLVALNIDNLRI